MIYQLSWPVDWFDTNKIIVENVAQFAIGYAQKQFHQISRKYV